MGGELHRDGIEAQLSGFFSQGSTEGTASGGSFAYTEAEMGTIIKNWLELAQSYDDSLYNASRMARVTSPATDMASKWHARSASQSGESYREYLGHNRDYCLQQAQLMQNALDDYLGVEHTNVIEINKMDPQDPMPRI